jgi:hypothetical protein
MLLVAGEQMHVCVGLSWPRASAKRADEAPDEHRRATAGGQFQIEFDKNGILRKKENVIYAASHCYPGVRKRSYVPPELLSGSEGGIFCVCLKKQGIFYLCISSPQSRRKTPTRKREGATSMLTSDDNSGSNGEARAQEGRLRFHRQSPQLRFHEAWVRWEYTAEEWALFEKVDWNPLRLTFWGLAVGCAASVIAAILPWFLFPPETTIGPLLSVFFPAVLCWCVCFPLTMRSLFSYIDARKRHKARQHEARTVTFSRKGVWEAGLFFPLDTFLEANLKKVTLTFDPPVLHFRLMRWHRGKNWRASPTSATLRVPVPRGQEEEAGFLLERFQTEVIQERVQTEKRLKNPPEPR